MARPKKIQDSELNENQIVKEVVVKSEKSNKNQTRFLLNLKTNKILSSDSFKNPKLFETYSKNINFKELPNINGQAGIEVADKSEYIAAKIAELDKREAELEKREALEN